MFSGRLYNGGSNLKGCPMDGYWLMFVFGTGFGVLLSYLVSDLVFEHKEFEDEGDRNDY